MREKSIGSLHPVIAHAWCQLRERLIAFVVSSEKTLAPLGFSDGLLQGTWKQCSCAVGHVNEPCHALGPTPQSV